MGNELILRISAGLIFFVLTAIRVYYTVAAIKSGSSFSVSRLDTPRAFLGWFLYTFILFLTLVYILTPGLLAWAALALCPYYSGYIGCSAKISPRLA